MRIGILGAGNIARSMSATLRGMRANGENVELWSVGSRDAVRAEEFAKREGFQKSFGSYRDMLDDPMLDLVYIATPHALHAEQMLMCLSSNKAVLCEKAFTGNAKQAEQVLQTARDRKILTAEAIWTRYMPSRRMIDDVLSSDEIGEVKAVTANLGYAISGVERIIRPELAGGALLDVGVYCLNFAAMVLGNDIERTSAVGTCMESGMDILDQITLFYRNGAVADLLTTAWCATDRFGVIYGTKGFLRVENINNPSRIEIWHPESSNLFPARVLPVPRQITGYEYEVRACMRAKEEGQIECCEMPHAETLRIMHQMDGLRQQLGIVYPFD
ncbi:MAG: Gfo/Idh/MocA family oxidoreductase [Clostridiales bacterium]|nr:Gfo/Idh/MocA family oxidoreductase [Clostridia bacterium]MCR4883812.1 Gfo/Idh/MocA family oxidoreductase [Clostridiales bacterium]